MATNPTLRGRKIETERLARLLDAVRSGPSRSIVVHGEAGVGKTALVEEALARIADPAGEGARTLTKVYAEQARTAADAQDALRRAGYVASPLAGLPASIKDLFDVAGEVTLAGSTALDDRPSATTDAPIVARLKAAGRRAPSSRPGSPHQRHRIDP